MIGLSGFLLSRLSWGACIGNGEVPVMVARVEFLSGLKGKATSKKQGPGGAWLLRLMKWSSLHTWYGSDLCMLHPNRTTSASDRHVQVDASPFLKKFLCSKTEHRSMTSLSPFEVLQATFSKYRWHRMFT